ncbi:PRD domain-containing protein [Opitutus sp. ER46]|uniref:BglG family transcription antiterminator n=1 Tax=Opitutus sp. ER46 TaxID=2161864 RepID=UPI000D31326E|nr:PRD domain-containing protein [Opitutus sp. ER46]PTX90983.1 hypothetical protein DB354_20255 [Opitutus sp. ER46]
MPFASSIPLRQRLILDQLLAAPGRLTAREIARAVGTSVRTIRRDLPQIEQLLRAYQIPLHRKAGTGLCLGGAPEHQAQLRQELPTSRVGQVRPVDRQAWLTCQLLASSGPLKLHALAIDLDVTITTITADLDVLDPWFRTRRLTLQRKRGHGVSLQGTENDRRHAIVEVFFVQFDEAALLSLCRDAARPVPPAGDALLHPAWQLLTPGHLPTAARLIDTCEAAGHFALEPAARLEFALHLAVFLERTGARRYCERLPGADAQTATLVEVLRPHVMGLVSFAPPEAELERLARFLQGLGAPPVDEKLPLLAQQFLLECESRLCVPVGADPALLDGLLSHLHRTQHRLRHHLEIRNPLLDQVRQNYPDVFAVARAAADATFVAPVLPDPEIGYLVMHLGSALQRRRQRRWRAAVVCPSGIGTSRLLSSRLRIELPEIDVIAVRPAHEAAAIDPAGCDLILSTVVLDLPHRRHVVVSPILPENDVRKIRATLAELGSPPQTVACAGGEALARLSDSHRRASFTLDLLHRWRVCRFTPGSASLTDALADLMAPLLADGTLAKGETHLDQLAHRLGQTPLVLPGSQLVFLHVRDHGITRPSLTLHVPERPIATADGTTIRQCLLMLAPQDLEPAQTAILSQLSSLFVEPATVAILASGDEAAARDYFARTLDQSPQN